MSILRQLFLLSACCLAAAAQDINPYPRDVVKTEKLIEWMFKTGAADWVAANQCALDATGGVLRIQSTGNDPYLFGPDIRIDGPVTARLRLKCAAGGNGQIFWRTEAMAGFDEPHSAHFQLIHDNQWHDYAVPLPETQALRQLRLDPAEGPGVIEVESVQLVRETLHPIEIQSIRTERAEVIAQVKNHSAQPISFTMNGRPFVLAANTAGEFSVIDLGKRPFRPCDIDIESPGLPAIHRIVEIIDTKQTSNWAALQSGDIVLRAARDGSGALLELGGRLVGVLAPLVSRDGATPKMKFTAKGNSLRWQGDGVALAVSVTGDVITSSIESAEPCEGPVLRDYGPLAQGVFPGLEYLAAGEHSSSTRDIETPEHVRFAPDPLKVTMPLMAFVTDRVMAAMTWSDMSLQPVFATPNFLDGPDGHRASLARHEFRVRHSHSPAGPHRRRDSLGRATPRLASFAGGAAFATSGNGFLPSRP